MSRLLWSWRASLVTMITGSKNILSDRRPWLPTNALNPDTQIIRRSFTIAAGHEPLDLTVTGCCKILNVMAQDGSLVQDVTSSPMS